MKSGISFYEKGIARNLLKRCWPLWAVYFAAMLLILPVSLSNTARHLSPYFADLSNAVLNCCCDTLTVCFVAGILAAMVLFSYLYNARSCGMMVSLPVHRETMYCTVFLIGLLPMLAADLLTALLTALCFSRSLLGWRYILIWLVTVCSGDILFFGFACFCAQLTGNIAVLPAVYTVLNFTVYVAEQCIRSLMAVFVYGMSATNGRGALTFLSPIVELHQNTVVSEVFVESGGRSLGTGVFYLRNMTEILIYAGVGLLLAFLGLLLYRRRRMETASDVVAVEILKPVFKYCMAFGTAVVFAALIYKKVIDDIFRGTAAAALLLVLMLLGAFLGYFAAEMLIRKTLRVFRGHWKGLAVTWLLLAAFVGLFEFDAFGYERAIPEQGDIESARLICRYEWAKLREPENIDSLLTIHRQILRDKKINENADDTVWTEFLYYMKDGSTVQRTYSISFDKSERYDSSSCLLQCQELINAPESILSRNETSVEIAAENITYACVNLYGSMDLRCVQLTAEQAEELYLQCVLPDMRDGAIGKRYLADNNELMQNQTNATLVLELRERDDPTGFNDSFAYFNVTVDISAARTMAWLRENLGVEPVSAEVADQPGYSPALPVK